MTSNFESQSLSLSFFKNILPTTDTIKRCLQKVHLLFQCFTSLFGRPVLTDLYKSRCQRCKLILCLAYFNHKTSQADSCPCRCIASQTANINSVRCKHLSDSCSMSVIYFILQKCNVGSVSLQVCQLLIFVVVFFSVFCARTIFRYVVLSLSLIAQSVPKAGI